MQGYLFSKLASLRKTTAAAFPIPFVARCPRLWQGTRNRGHPLLATGHPSVNHWTVHLATEAPTPSPSNPSLLVLQHPQNTHQNTTFASRDELTPGSPVPKSQLPAPATPTTLLAAGYAGGTDGKPVPKPKCTGAGISALPHQISRPDWLHGGCHLVASRCITPLPSLQCPGLSQEMEAPAPVCSFSQEGARLPTVVQRAVHARLSCKAHGFGATQARSQLLQAASSGFLFKGGSAPLPQSHCGSAGTCANPLPACHTRVCLDRDFGGSCIPPVRAPDPLAAGSTHSAVPPLPLAGHQLFTSPACDFRSMAFMMFSGALSCRAGSGQGHCTQSGSCKLKPARDKLKTKGQRCAGQERLGFAFLLLQKPQHGCHGHGHAQVPAGITLNIPQGPDLAPQGRMLRAAQPAALGPWLLPPLPSPTDSVQSIFARNRAGTMQL